MRRPKPTGRSTCGYSKNGKAWLTRDELMHMRWYAEVMNSKKKRGDRNMSVNLD
jgi:hypothetical protein